MSRKRVSKLEMNQLRTAMVHEYPNCFVAPGLAKRPLKIGIKRDLLKDAREKFPGLSHRHISAFMTDYVTGIHYFQACRKGAVRVGLAGTFSGFVDDDAAEYAKACIALLNAGKRIPNPKRDPAGPVQVGEALFGAPTADPLVLSYEQWAGMNRKHMADVMGLPARVIGLDAAATSGMAIMRLDGSIVTATIPLTLEQELERLKYFQYAASMSNNWYHSDGSKAKDDAAIAELERRIRERDAK